MAKRTEFLHNTALSIRAARRTIPIESGPSSKAMQDESARRAALNFQSQVKAHDEEEHRALQRSYSFPGREGERLRKEIARKSNVARKEMQKLYTDLRNAQLNLMNAQLVDQVNQLENLLQGALSVDSYVNIGTLRIVPQIPQYVPPQIGTLPLKPDPQKYIPPEPTGLAKVLPSVKDKYRQDYAAARERYREDFEKYKQKMLALKATVDSAWEAYKHQVTEIRMQAEAHNLQVDQFQVEFEKGQSQAIIDYFAFVLEASVYPKDFPQHTKVAFIPESKQLVVEYDLPSFDIVPEFGVYKYVKPKDEITGSPRLAAQRKSLYSSVIAQITIRTIHELFEADRAGHLETVVFNGYVDAIDRGTGRQLRECLVTVRVTRDTFLSFDLSRLDPIACLKVMNAGVSKTPEELAPVKPVLEFSMVDPRFVEESDILSSLDQRPNLMELSPTEFESLIANLFEKMGLETRQTQASRDGGVDCVAYDPRPILGGKVVIQAKRYKHTVGVSAVRDLFGTLQNEGASKGILVTTSGFGKASFEFASGKPIELIAGGNLLYLLEEYAGVKAKIVPPEDWKDPQADSGDEESVEDITKAQS